MTSFYIVTSYDIKCTEVFFPTALPIFISVLNTAEFVLFILKPNVYVIEEIHIGISSTEVNFKERTVNFVTIHCVLEIKNHWTANICLIVGYCNDLGPCISSQLVYQLSYLGTGDRTRLTATPLIYFPLKTPTKVLFAPGRNVTCNSRGDQRHQTVTGRKCKGLDRDLNPVTLYLQSGALPNELPGHRRPNSADHYTCVSNAKMNGRLWLC
jgi:hypothetical protein